MFNNGILKALKNSIPKGGQHIPNSIEGDNLQWKNLQKNDKKKNTSEIINNNIPNFKPNITWLVWNPWYVLSRVMSRHQVYIVIKIIIKPIKNKLIVWLLNNFVVPVNIIITPNAPVRGQGLLLTKWKLWLYFIKFL